MLIMHSGMYDKIVEVQVGPEGRNPPFYLHTGLLCHHSPYFRATIQGKFKEANAGVIRLAHDKYQVVNTFKAWLYTSNILEVSCQYTKWDQLCHFLLKCWLWADMRGATCFQNAIIDNIIDAFERYWQLPSLDDSVMIYENTTKDSPLRKLLVDFIAITRPDIKGWTKVCRELGEEYPSDLYLDLLERREDLRSQDWFVGKGTYGTEFHKCKYHIHQMPCDRTEVAESDTCIVVFKSKKFKDLGTA